MKTVFSKDDTTAVKGVALLFLLHHHNFCQYTRFQNYEVSFFPFTSEAIVRTAAFLKICVGMFAFLSAYGLTLSLKKYSPDTCLSGEQTAHYFKNRYIKLMWGFWFAYIISCAACALLKPDQFLVYFPIDDTERIVHGIFYIILDFTGISCLMNSPTLNGTWWYMSLAIFLAAVVPITAKLNKKYGSFYTIVLFLFIPRLIFLGNHFVVGESTNILRWAFSAFLGVEFAQNDLLAKMKAFKFSSNKYLSKTLKFLAATLLFIILYSLYRSVGGSFANYCYEFRDCVIPLFVIYYFYDFIIDIPVLRNILILIGKHSMNIFFIHTFIRLYFFEAFTYSFGNWFLIDFVLLLDSLAVSIIVELIKKAVRYDKLMNNVLNTINKSKEVR